MSKCAADIVAAALLQGDHPLRIAIEQVLRWSPSCPTVELHPSQVAAIASDILQALMACDLGDVPSDALRRRVETLLAENNGLVLALARLSLQAAEDITP